MNDEKRRAIEECRKINDVLVEVKFAGMMGKLFKIFVTQKSNPHSDIPMFSHLIKSYFEPAMKKHESGDYCGAMKLYKEAIESGSQLACFILSQYYVHGVGVEQDKKEFLSLLERGGIIRDGCIPIYSVLVNSGFSKKISLNLEMSLLLNVTIYYSNMFHL